MSSPFRSVCAALLLLAACDREDRRFTEAAPGGTSANTVRLSPLQPGPVSITSVAGNPYDENAYAVAQGQRLYAWYNCAGCHANGGGGMGPPLMDEQWVYGSAADQIYSSIMQGRPNGMPSWAGRIPEPQVWQIVAYVRSLSGLVPPNARGARADHMMTFPGSLITENPRQTKQSFTPPASEKP